MTDQQNTTEKQNLLFKQQQKPYCYLVMLKYNRVMKTLKSAKLKRKDINGFSFNALGYTFEVVTIKHLPRVFTISKPIYKTLWRGEF